MPRATSQATQRSTAVVVAYLPRPVAPEEHHDLIGNGYAPRHAEFTLETYWKNVAVKKWFDEKFGG